MALGAGNDPCGRGESLGLPPRILDGMGNIIQEEGISCRQHGGPLAIGLPAK
jgi:hypothetical protein